MRMSNLFPVFVLFAASVLSFSSKLCLAQPNPSVINRPSSSILFPVKGNVYPLGFVFCFLASSFIFILILSPALSLDHSFVIIDYSNFLHYLQSFHGFCQCWQSAQGFWSRYWYRKWRHLGPMWCSMYWLHSGQFDWCKSNRVLFNCFFLLFLFRRRNCF